MTETLKIPIPLHATQGQINAVEVGFVEVLKYLGGIKVEFKRNSEHLEAIVEGEKEKLEELNKILVGMLEVYRGIQA